MDHYILAQLIGLAGYLIIIISPLFSEKKQMIKSEIGGCVLLSLQWILLSQPALLVSNIVAIGVSLVALSTLGGSYKDKVLCAFYPIAVVLILLIWEGTLVDFFVLGALFCMITSRRISSESAFRCCAITGGGMLAISGALALSVPGAICNLLFVVGHIRKLCRHEIFPYFPRISRV